MLKAMLNTKAMLMINIKYNTNNTNIKQTNIKLI